MSQTAWEYLTADIWIRISQFLTIREVEFVSVVHHTMMPILMKSTLHLRRMERFLTLHQRILHYQQKRSTHHQQQHRNHLLHADKSLFFSLGGEFEDTEEGIDHYFEKIRHVLHHPRRILFFFLRKHQKHDEGE
jgi:hypothetical protein